MVSTALRMKKSQAVLAASLSLITGGMVGSIFYLSFIFPKMPAVWEEEAQTLSASQVLMANASSFCTSYGLLILPIFLVCFLASLVWLILAIKKKSTSNNDVKVIP